MSIQRSAIAVLSLLQGVFAGCAGREKPYSDHPRVAANVVLSDVSFHSRALGRQMRYRVALPSSASAQQELPVVFLLHGGGGDFRDWSNNSDVTRFADAKLALVMPQGDYSYYVNAADPPTNRYEDYIVQDLISDVETRFPVASQRSGRAIAGVSMGGFGAMKIALSHPDLFAFAGALSPAIDAARRSFSIRRVQQYRAMEVIFGPWGSMSRRNNDPFSIVQSVNAATAPFLFLTCGDSEGLLPATRDFEALLAARRLEHEFHVVGGGHDWKQWNSQLPGVFSSLSRRIGQRVDSAKWGTPPTTEELR